MVNDLVVEARGIAAEITDLRHLLHQHPEAGMQLPLTQQTVLDALAGLPLEVSTGTSCTSVTAVLRGGAAPERIEDRVVVLLRADMDGLPVQEETGMPFASQRDGFMHACGHDIHTATLVGAARLLCAHQSELAGDVVFMFQPGEELLQGARAMIAEGVLDAAGKRADAAYGMHVFSSVFPAGEFATRPGTLMAASDTMFVDIIGKGGHGSTPYLANDPVPVMAEVILGLQTLTAKKFSQFDPVVINVGVARAGDAANIIPESCHSRGVDPYVLHGQPREGRAYRPRSRPECLRGPRSSGGDHVEKRGVPVGLPSRRDRVRRRADPIDRRCRTAPHHDRAARWLRGLLRSAGPGARFLRVLLRRGTGP